MGLETPSFLSEKLWYFVTVKLQEKKKKVKKKKRNNT